ncbi:MAG TPA: polyphosphate kinase 2, partial [Aestuariivirga sp.]|nr:polyphosphate kinase 2 [Aestuariivirga sp.]
MTDSKAELPPTTAAAASAPAFEKKSDKNGSGQPPAAAIPQPPRQRRDADAIRHAFESGEYPYNSRLSTKAYEKEMERLQVELLKAQSWVKEKGEKIVIIFEGRDAAGKGGTIKRFMEHLNPRGARVVALEKPSEREKTQWYFQRYIENLPAAGEIVFFDRSWYNRAGVER